MSPRPLTRTFILDSGSINYAVGRLLGESRWVQVEPRPDSEYAVTVKDEPGVTWLRVVALQEETPASPPQDEPPADIAVWDAAIKVLELCERGTLRAMPEVKALHDAFENHPDFAGFPVRR